MTRRRSGRLLMIVFFMLMAIPGSAGVADAGWHEAGARMGVTVKKKDENFKIYEAFGAYGLPWQREWLSGWRFDTGLTLGGGLLEGEHHDSGFMGTFGPVIRMYSPDRHFSLSAAVRLALLTKYDFRGQDLGGVVNFSEEIGLDFHMGRGWNAGYRFQHLSNGGLYDNNPGLDFHLFELTYRF
ncbi:acyloxyacyl hydrolase [Desulfonema ishimotonii]|uniref:Acyloxyacyl hydrolase n=1 Tax=Desulfonema ishimotonii TaxID=45657 RepID=A0A401G3F1_9BACT|nr:acyloxyacyl hydrolase [Desulfonema ishimotonii]GBC63645.1 acyloxyacyl hydrolase [Desulfonema ishimotonii]